MKIDSDRYAKLLEENERLRKTLESIIDGVQQWCNQISEQGSGWDNWEHHYKYYQYGGLEAARAALENKP